MRDFIYRLFFTREDDLDLLQLVFLGWVFYVSFVVWKVGSGEWTLPTAAWSVIASVFATLAISGTPAWVAHLLAKRPQPQMFPSHTQLGGYSFTDADDQYYGVDSPEVE